MKVLIATSTTASMSGAMIVKLPPVYSCCKKPVFGAPRLVSCVVVSVGAPVSAGVEVSQVPYAAAPYALFELSEQL